MARGQRADDAPVARGFGLILAMSLGCGARTELPSGDADLTPGVDPVPVATLDPCETPGQTRPCKTLCGEGVETCQGGFFDGCTAKQPSEPPAAISIAGTVHDLRSSHPDFEKFLGEDPGIVQPTLGPDRLPIYAGTPTTPTTTGAQSFFAWFHDVPGVSASAQLSLPMQRLPGLGYVFDSASFFPIDGQLFGNEGFAHNFHFTCELHASFRYRGGEVLTFSGDDDVFVFLADRLVIDLGGVHATSQRTVHVDAIAGPLGMTVGSLYPFDLFFAERHTSGSTFHLETTIEAFDPCAP